VLEGEQDVLEKIFVNIQVDKNHKNQSFIENPKKRKLIADAIKEPDNSNKRGRGWFGGVF
jgi:hypothetical protein